MKKSLHENLTAIAEEKLIGGKGDNPKGSFKQWLDSKEGRAALAKGIKVEMEHTKDRAIAREIAIDHLKEDKKYYEKLAKVGLDEGLWDDRQDFHHDGTDDLDDPADDNMAIAIAALKDPERAKRQVIRNPSATSHLIAALNTVVSRANQILKSIPKPAVQKPQTVAVESAMAFSGSTAVGGNPGDKGTGVPVMQPHAGQKMKFTGGKLKMGKPGKGGMRPDAAIGGKSAFAKGTL